MKCGAECLYFWDSLLLRSAATTSVGAGRRHSSATVFCRTALFSLGWIPGADLVAPSSS